MRPHERPSMNVPDIAKLTSAEVLARYDILDTPAEPAFDDLARRAADVFGATMAGISFFNTGTLGSSGAKPWREWFKSRLNFPVDALAREHSFFLPAASGTDHRLRIFVVPDALADKRFVDHPLVSGPPHICFYAGAAIVSKEGAAIGVLSVFDTVAREAVPRELEALINLADLTRARLEARAERRMDSRLERGVVRGRSPASAAPAASVPAAGSIAAADQHVEHVTREFLRLEQLLEDEIVTRKAAEDRLRDEKDFADAAIHSLPGAFFMFDTHGKMVRWNKSFADTTGYSPDDMQSKRALRRSDVLRSVRLAARRAGGKLYAAGAV